MDENNDHYRHVIDRVKQQMVMEWMGVMVMVTKITDGCPKLDLMSYKHVETRM